MVQEEPLKLYGKTVEEFLEWVYLDPSSESGLRWRKTSSSTAVKDSVAGCYSKTVKHPCWRIKIDKKAMVVARVVWFLRTGKVPDVVDHIKGDTYNHSGDSLRDVSQRVNCQNRVVKNTIGVMGVYKTVDKYGNPSWKCQGTDINGKRWTRNFSINKYGEENALKMAIEKRKIMERSNNTQTREVSCRL